MTLFKTKKIKRKEDDEMFNLIFCHESIDFIFYRTVHARNRLHVCVYEERNQQARRKKE